MSRAFGELIAKITKASQEIRDLAKKEFEPLLLKQYLQIPRNDLMTPVKLEEALKIKKELLVEIYEEFLDTVWKADENGKNILKKFKKDLDFALHMFGQISDLAIKNCKLSFEAFRFHSNPHWAEKFFQDGFVDEPCENIKIQMLFEEEFAKRRYYRFVIKNEHGNPQVYQELVREDGTSTFAFKYIDDIDEVVEEMIELKRGNSELIALAFKKMKNINDAKDRLVKLKSQNFPSLWPEVTWLHDKQDRPANEIFPKVGDHVFILSRNVFSFKNGLWWERQNKFFESDPKTRKYTDDQIRNKLGTLRACNYFNCDFPVKEWRKTKKMNPYTDQFLTEIDNMNIGNTIDKIIKTQGWDKLTQRIFLASLGRLVRNVGEDALNYFVYFLGVSGCGKSTLMKYICSLYPSWGIVLLPPHIAKDFGTQGWPDANIIACNDCTADCNIPEQLLLSATSGEGLETQQKHKLNKRLKKFYAMFALAGNSVPRLKNTLGNIARRLMLHYFPVVPSEPDGNIERRIYENMGRIMYLCNMCLRWWLHETKSDPKVHSPCSGNFWPHVSERLLSSRNDVLALMDPYVGFVVEISKTSHPELEVGQFNRMPLKEFGRLIQEWARKEKRDIRFVFKPEDCRQSYKQIAETMLISIADKQSTGKYNGETVTDFWMTGIGKRVHGIGDIYIEFLTLIKQKKYEKSGLEFGPSMFIENRDLELLMTDWINSQNKLPTPYDIRGWQVAAPLFGLEITPKNEEEDIYMVRGIGLKSYQDTVIVPFSTTTTTSSTSTSTSSASASSLQTSVSTNKPSISKVTISLPTGRGQSSSSSTSTTTATSNYFGSDDDNETREFEMIDFNALMGPTKDQSTILIDTLPSLVDEEEPEEYMLDSDAESNIDNLESSIPAQFQLRNKRQKDAEDEDASLLMKKPRNE